MPLPISADVLEGRHFHDTLQQWAKRLVRTDAEANRIVQRTISVLCDCPDLLDGPHMNEAIFALLRRHAFDDHDPRLSFEDEPKASRPVSGDVVS